ncbi:MAG: AsmA-like C-terminal region-containing protein, partial [Dongiaceae bacterium]
TITYRETARGINSTIDVSTLSGESEGEEHLRLIGKGDFQEHPFSLEAMGASILQLRDSGKPYPFKLHTKIGDTEIKAEGSAIDPVKLEGLNIQFNLKGKNAADLFPIFGIALLPSPPYELGGHLTYLNGGDNAEWHFSDFSGKMGNSDISGDVSWQPSKKPPYFTGQFISNNLALADLAPFIGIKPQEAKKDARALPDTSLDISRLIAMNADVTFRGTHVKTPEVLDDFLMVASLQNGALTLNPLKFGQGQGTIQAIAKIEGLADPPKATVDASFERLSLERFFGPLAKTYGEKNVSIGLLGGRAKLVGYGKSLRDVLGTSDGAIGIGMEGGQLSRLLLEIIGLDLYKTAGLIIKGDEPAKIRCVVANFEAEKGILHTREFLIDTSVTVIRGKGTVNLKSEKLDMRLEVYPKDASLLSVRSPILITGSLKKPSVMPDPAALAARGGIVAALGALLTPIGAMLGFIEPSLGKDSNCAAFLQELQQETGAKVPKEKK